MNRWFLTGLCAAALFFWWHGSNPSVATVTDDDYQYPGYAIEAAKPYAMEARVLRRQNYRTGRESELSPVDLALGWGPMRDPHVLADIQISQRNRFYFWRVDSFPIPRRDIERNSANVHIIPASQAIADKLDMIEEGDIIRLSGQLVNVTAQDGWRWKSSLTFNDTGDGACELVWLESLDII